MLIAILKNMVKWIALVAVILSFAGSYVYQGAGKEIYIAPHQEKSTTTKPLLFTGDIMLGRYVETLARNENDPSRSFREVESLLKNHITIANLEGPIPEKHMPTLINGMSFSFASSTPRVVKEGGVAAVSLANNHMFDRGQDGYEATKRALKAAGVAHFGGYSPLYDYFETALGSRRVLVYGLTTISSQWNEEEALEVTRTLRAHHDGAYLIAFMHWGDEYVTQNKYQRELAHKLIGLGVDAIIGAHPHVVQGIEVYNGKPIFYSLGNFIFDQYWRKDLENGLLMRIAEDGRAYRYDLIPIHSKKSVPYVATSTKRDEILASVASQSDTSLKESILSGSLEIVR